MKKSVDLREHDYQPLALSIYVDAVEIPQGVVVLLSDWPKLKSAVDPKSPFYKLMDKLTFIPFHERSLTEKSEFLESKLREVEKENLVRGSFRTYQNELCTAPNLFINEYADRTELVSVDARSGKISLIKKLS
ncbi:hypothetical protein QFZ20_003069 [Flavobacterium sp. W4I14]|nr:hypothetical protein [Flavobacterium sp. W4I14]